MDHAPLLVIRGYGVNGAVYGHILGVSAASIISVLLIGYILRGEDGKTPSQPSESSLPGMFRFGFPLFLTMFLGTLDSSYRGILLAWFIDNVTIGNFDVAIKFLSLVSIFTLPIATVIYPAFSKFTYQRQPEEMKALYRTSVRYSTLIVIPAVTVLIILSRQGIGFLFGSRYELAPRFLSLALLSYLAVGLGSLSVFGFLNSQGDTTTTFRLNAITVGLRMIVGTVLTWQWGVPGLLIGLFASTMAGNLLNLYVVRRKYGVSVDLTHTVKVGMFSVLAAIITGQSLLLLPTLGFFLQGVVGSIVFFVACMFLAPLSRAFMVSDINTLRKMFEKERIIYLILTPFLTLEERIIRIIS